MPERVYRGKSAYEYRPTNGHCIKLCSIDSPRSLVLRRHADEYERFHAGRHTIGAMVSEYFDSSQFAKLSQTTRDDYAKHWKNIKKVFQKTDARKLKPEHVRKYMDLKGKSSENQANHHHSFLSAAFSWGYERGKVSANPCKGVKKFKIEARDRYIEDHEYKALYDHASIAVQVAMEISYLCAARQGDVLALTRDQILPEGIKIKQGKTGKLQVKRWSPRLRAAIELAKQIKTANPSTIIIPTRTGAPYSSDGFRTMVAKAKKKAREATGLAMDFTYHDIKAKSISDYEGNKQEFSGHKTYSQVAIYDRKPQVVDSLNVPNINDNQKGK